jgi:hypothetical protein
MRYIFLLARRAYSWLFQLAQMWKLLAPGIGLVDFLTPADTTSSNLFVIINDLKKIFLTCNKIRALLQKIGSRVMLPSINSNVLAFKIIRKL